MYYCSVFEKDKKHLGSSFSFAYVLGDTIEQGVRVVIEKRKSDGSTVYASGDFQKGGQKIRIVELPGMKFLLQGEMRVKDGRGGYSNETGCSMVLKVTNQRVYNSAVKAWNENVEDGAVDKMEAASPEEVRDYGEL